MLRDKAEAMLSEITQRLALTQGSWREAMIHRASALGFYPDDVVELRITATDGDVVALAQRAADVFFTAMRLYPTSIAAHSAIVSLLTMRGAVIKASHGLPQYVDAIFGEGFETAPIPFEIDDSLDATTIAVRFKIDLDSPEIQEALQSVIIKAVLQAKKAGKP